MLTGNYNYFYFQSASNEPREITEKVGLMIDIQFDTFLFF